MSGGRDLPGGRQQPSRESFDLLGGVLLAAGPAALVVRRRFPVPVYPAAFVTTLSWLARARPGRAATLDVVHAIATS